MAPRENIRPSPEVLARRKAEIAARYRAKSKQAALAKKPRALAAIRMSELTRLYDHRHGPRLLPEDDVGLLCAKVMVHHIGALRDAPRRISDWLACCAPWLSLASRERLIRDATERPIRWSADKLAWKLRVTAAERTNLDLRTIGCIDMTKEQRAAQAKERRRQRDRIRYRTQSREEYLHAVRTPKPWTRLGMSRAAWYRAGRPTPA